MHEPGRLTLAALGVCCAICLSQAGSAAAKTTPGKITHRTSRFGPGAMPAGARFYYATTYGVDDLSAQLAETGQLVRFSYRIVDGNLAKPLLEKVSNPNLLDERAHAVLSVPTMEKVGPLRQAGPPEPGKIYWVLFSNRGGVVRPGDRVSVVIGSFRADGLIVQK